jgi:hypothetical protein
MNQYNLKDVFLERATATDTFEEYVLRAQPNSVVVTDAYGNLVMVDTASISPNPVTSNSSSASYLQNEVTVIDNVGPATFLGGISSVGVGIEGEQFGTSAQANGDRATAIGPEADAFGDNSVAVGYAATGDGIGTIGIGANSDVQGDLSIGLGAAVGIVGPRNTSVGASSATNECSNSVAVGFGSQVIGYNYSTVIGSFTIASANHQITLGTISEFVNIPGTLTASNGQITFGNDGNGTTQIMIGNAENSGEIHLSDSANEVFYSITTADGEMHVNAPLTAMFGDLNIKNGKLIAPNITGSLNGTASYAQTASYLNNANILMQFSSSTVTLVPQVTTGSTYVDVTKKLLFIYSGTQWMSSSLA